MKKIALITCSLFALALSFHAKTQDLNVLSTSGGSFSNENINVSWTIGELTIETFSSENIILTQGFHQSLLTPVSISEENENGEETILIYPNPANNYIIIELSEELLSPNSSPVKIRIYNNQGKLLLTQPIHELKTTIDLEHYAQGMYYLSLSDPNSIRLKTHIIQKQ